MAEQSQFGEKPEATTGGLRCEEWERLLADALDGLLPARDAAAFAAHSAGCRACADLLAHAKQGREWLGYLHTEPEVPAGLVEKILEKTAGAGSIPAPLVAGAPQVAGAAAIPWRRSFHEMRLLMTVAMAFFSIALTLNLAGVKLTNLRIADLRPATIGGALSRQFYGAQGTVVRFYDNLRFVYQLQSRMRELRRDADVTPTPKQPPSSRNGSAPAAGGAQGQVLKVESSVPAETRIPPLAAADNGNSPKLQTAGPRRLVETAGYEGRSLA